MEDYTWYIDENGIISTAYSEEDEIALPDIVKYLQKSPR